MCLAKMNNLPKHHGAGPPEARGPMQLHRLKVGPEWKALPPLATRLLHVDPCGGGLTQFQFKIFLAKCKISCSPGMSAYDLPLTLTECNTLS